MACRITRVCGTESVTKDQDVEKRAPITVKFEIPYFTVSGIQVRYLKIVEKSGYQALPWVRYITQNGDDYRYKYSPSFHRYCRSATFQSSHRIGKRQCTDCANVSLLSRYCVYLLSRLLNCNQTNSTMIVSTSPLCIRPT